MAGKPAVLAARLAVLFAIWKFTNKTPPNSKFDPEFVQESFTPGEADLIIREVQVMLETSTEVVQ